MLFDSAFDPTLCTWYAEIDPTGREIKLRPDLYNNWNVPLPADFVYGSGYFVPDSPNNSEDLIYKNRMVPPQLWVETSEKSLFVLLGTLHQMSTLLLSTAFKQILTGLSKISSLCPSQF